MGKILTENYREFEGKQILVFLMRVVIMLYVFSCDYAEVCELVN